MKDILQITGMTEGRSPSVYIENVALIKYTQLPTLAKGVWHAPYAKQRMDR